MCWEFRPIATQWGGGIDSDGSPQAISVVARATRNAMLYHANHKSMCPQCTLIATFGSNESDGEALFQADPDDSQAESVVTY